MLREAIHHTPSHKWAYAYDLSTYHIRLRTRKNDVEDVVMVAGDKYDWNGNLQEIVMEKIASDQLFDYWEGVIIPKYKRFSYGFRLHAGTETMWKIETGFYAQQPTPPGGYFEVPYIHEVDLFDAPDWAKNAVFYQIMVDRFNNGNKENDHDYVRPWGETPDIHSHFGGDMQGILDKLDYISDLGVNSIYLTPLFTSPSNHKYDTVDYHMIDPQFGDLELLKKLVDACHKRSIRVVLDAVFNHVSEQFPHFQDVLKHGEKSKYKDWFHLNHFPVAVQDGKANYDTFGFYGNMPKLNTANPEVKKYLLDVAVHWIREADIDGWRLDVADEIDHHFWREFRGAVKAVKYDTYIIGEVWGDALRWLQGDQFDSSMNYPFTNSVLDFFSSNDRHASDFAEEVNRLLMRYPQQTNEALLNLLSSHDIPRSLTRMGGDKRRAKLAAVFMMTSMGVPCVFYGDEVGLQGGGDPDCRKCMEWDEAKQDRDLHDFYRIIISLRKKHEALRCGRFRFLQASSEKGTFVYERMNNKQHFTIWMNNTEEDVFLAHPMLAGGWRDALTEEEVATFENQLRIELEPMGYRILYRNI